MRERQRELGEQGNVVIEGRDIGTVVAPEAEREGLPRQADPEVRAERRQAERPDIGADALATDLRPRDESRRASACSRPTTRCGSTRPTSRSTTSSTRIESARPRARSREHRRRRRLGGRPPTTAAGRRACSRRCARYGIERVPLHRRPRARDQPLPLDRPARSSAPSRRARSTSWRRSRRTAFPVLGRLHPRLRHDRRAARRVRPRRGAADARGRARRPRARPLRRGHAAEERRARRRCSRARRWSRSRRTCPSSRSRSTAPSSGSPATSRPCSVAWGEPIRFEGLPKGGKGYKEASAEIERRICACSSTGSRRCTRTAARGRRHRRHERRPRPSLETRARDRRHRRDRRLPERRQVDARQPAHRRRAQAVVHETPGVDPRPQGAGLRVERRALPADRHRRRRRRGRGRRSRTEIAEQARAAIERGRPRPLRRRRARRDHARRRGARRHPARGARSRCSCSRTRSTTRASDPARSSSTARPRRPVARSPALHGTDTGDLLDEIVDAAARA